jgi:hypothetical protein
MRLIGNKRDVINNKVMVNICCKERDIKNSNNNIFYKQDMYVHRLANSNYLKDRTYNDINRE